MVHAPSFLLGGMLCSGINLIRLMQRAIKVYPRKLLQLENETNPKIKKRLLNDFLREVSQVNKRHQELMEIYNNIRGKKFFDEELFLKIEDIKEILLGKEKYEIKEIKLDAMLTEKIKRLENLRERILFLRLNKYKMKLIPLHLRKKFEEVIDIYSIGYFETSILVLGKILEGLITDYLLLANKVKKIKLAKKNVESMTFQNKIEYAESEKLISRSDASKITSLKWERNIGAHPSKKEDVDKLSKDVEALISIGFNQIINLSDKINEIKKFKILKF